MSIGDVNSTERGSGARYNDGKAPLEQIPLTVWNTYFDEYFDGWVMDALWKIEFVQTSEKVWSLTTLMATADPEIFRMAADVFQYGAEKYAQWNWCKGMPWTVPLGCALRHLLAITEGEELDPESGLPHLGHFACNMIMLEYFATHYPEGQKGFTI